MYYKDYVYIIYSNKNMENREFINNCESCGAQCCRNWNPAYFDKNIVDENGICIYLNTQTNLCTIYEKRPIFCRTYAWYEKTYSSTMSLERYLHEQKMGCKTLKKIAERRNKNYDNSKNY